MANTMSKKEALYAKKVANRKLGSSLEFTTSRLGYQVSAALALVFWFFARKGSVMWMGVAGVYTVAFLLQFIINKRIVKEVTGLGLAEAKAVVDGAPKVLKEAASKEDAESIKAKLEEVGAKVTLK